MNTRHITRFTYEFTNFQGWRVAINRQGIALARYFSDKQYGDSEKAFAEALKFRDEVLQELKQHPERAQEILLDFRARERRVYPAGLKPAVSSSREGEVSASAFSMRGNKVLNLVLQRICKHFKLDTASVFKLSLYLFAAQYGAHGENADFMKESPSVQVVSSELSEEQCALKLQQLINELEFAGYYAGMPDFEEFSTGRSTGCRKAQTPEVVPFFDNFNAAERYMRSPRPSPPQSHLSDTMPSHSPFPSTLPFPLASASLTESVCSHRKASFIPYSPDPSNDNRPQSRKRARLHEEQDIIPPPDAV